MCNYSSDMYRDAKLKILNQGDCKFCQASQLSQTYKKMEFQQFNLKNMSILHKNLPWSNIVPCEIKSLIIQTSILKITLGKFLCFSFSTKAGKSVIIVFSKTSSSCLSNCSYQCKFASFSKKRKGNKNYISETVLMPHIQNLKCVHMLSVKLLERVYPYWYVHIIYNVMYNFLDVLKSKD